ncbi:hypothetical protein EI546_02190 [Aequorivita sp. H23M31]|uniref:Transposase IS200-like domain-containing protein n=1 Tax=Aequorivita ciconiae TaxID=2494375 RepID=A0A410G040_9FLAO|nr:transposase [Aequorivita sp. H23M31]QAA80610.1 hypothetical protein EI546_02190 [Aequorivita sp. H23M31]
MERYKNKYRIQSHRKPGWDYSNVGRYFITLVYQNRVCNLGAIVNGNMILSDFGKIVRDEWLKSFEIRNELFLDEYVIMPNHIHAIVVLDNQKNRIDAHDGVDNPDPDDAHNPVEAHGRALYPNPRYHPRNHQKQNHSTACQNRFRHLLRGLNRR